MNNITERRCFREHPDPLKTQKICRVCWNFTNIEKYNKLWGGDGVLHPCAWGEEKPNIIASIVQLWNNNQAKGCGGCGGKKT